MTRSPDKVSRAGEFAFESIRREQYEFARREWRALSLFAGLILGVNVMDFWIDEAFVRGLLAGTSTATAIFVVISLVVLATGTAPRLMGANAERFTAQEVQPLREHGYEILHHSGLGPGDIDHVLVGPGGVFVIETKWSSKAWDGQSPHITLSPGLRQVRQSAHKMRLTANRFGVRAVVPVLAVWGQAGRDLTAHNAYSTSVELGRAAFEESDVAPAVVPGLELRRWLLSQGRGQLTEQQVESLSVDLRRLTEMRDALEIRGPMSVKTAVARALELALVSYLGLLATLLTLGLLPLFGQGILVSSLFIASLLLRRQPRLRVDATALAAIQGFWIVVVLVDVFR